MSPAAKKADQAPGRHKSSIPVTIVWILLLGFSLLNYYLAEGLSSGKTLAMLVFAASFLKLSMVAGAFMELWSSGRPYFYIALGLFAGTLGLLTLLW